MPLPRVPPMLAVAGKLPGPNRGDYAVEMKWDGVRAVSYWDGRSLRLLSRNDNDLVDGYPELAQLGVLLGTRAAILDGEIVAHDESGRPSFGALQARMHVRGHRVASLAQQVPASYLIFDVLHLAGDSTIALPYSERRQLLEDLDLAGDHVAVPPAFHIDADVALRVSREQGLEGVVVKTLTASYRPGRRSPAWNKVKHAYHQEVVIGGWSPGEGGRTGRIGSLLVGVHNDADQLVYAGHVGTGFSRSALDALATLLLPLSRPSSPFIGDVPRPHARDARWVAPHLVGEVVFTEWTREGRLRHPSWRGMRPEKDPSAVRREPLLPPPRR